MLFNVFPTHSEHSVERHRVYIQIMEKVLKPLTERAGNQRWGGLSLSGLGVPRVSALP
jgi:hypothetical protein